MSFGELVSFLDEQVAWGPVMLILLVGVGLYFTIRTRFVQFRKLGYALKNTVGKVFKKTKAEKGELTPWQSMTTALAATVGTGSIVGVTGAIAIGGPGAIFWMWVSALVGMITKYAEVVLSVHYRERNEKGERVGGPMYYIKNGLGAKWKWLAVIFCLFGILASFGIGNATQVNSIASSVESTASAFGLETAQITFMGSTFSVIRLITGIVLAVIVALVVIGGLKTIGSVTEKMVPFMSIVYIVAGLVFIFLNFDQIGAAFGMIFKGAFNPSSVIGGAAGATLLTVMQKGISRGCFSNEAGLGSAPIAHASTSETNPVKQGMYGIFEVFITSMIICTITGLILLCGHNAGGITINWGEGADGTLVAASMGSVFGEKISVIIVSVCLILFSLSTIISWSLYGTRCFEFIANTKVIFIYKIVFVLFVVVGATLKLDVAWSMASAFNGFMAIPNLIAILLLSPVVIKLTKEYFDNKK